jgi:hypothetical protein
VSGFLGDPVWQGVSGLIALLGLALSGVELRRRFHGHDRRTSDSDGYWETFDLSTEEGQAAYYQELAKSIALARESIYRAGRGFSRPQRGQAIENLVRAERTALANGVEITRIQLSSSVTEKWANDYADLVASFPDQLRVYADYGEPPLVNVAVIDPHGSLPAIQLLFESHELAADGDRFRSAAALFLKGHKPLAISLQAQFEDRAKVLQRMTSDEVRDLAKLPTYFAYGSNMSCKQMQDRCPSAQLIGAAYLYGWRRSFCVPAPHLAGLAAGIERSKNDTAHVIGVAYRMTESDQRKLDEIERGGYTPVRVGIKVGGSHREAFTHVPVVTTSEVLADVPRPYLRIMIAGAEENGLTDLANEWKDLVNE